MEEIILWQYNSLKAIWNLMTQYWFLCGIPVAIILIIVINMIKGAINR